MISRMGTGGDILIGHLDADGGLIGDGGFDAHPACRQVQGNIIGQIGDAADLDAGRGLQFIPGNGRPRGKYPRCRSRPRSCAAYPPADRHCAQLLWGIAATGGLGLFQQVDRREGVGFFLRTGSSSTSWAACAAFSSGVSPKCSLPSLASAAGSPTTALPLTARVMRSSIEVSAGVGRHWRRAARPAGNPAGVPAQGWTPQACPAHYRNRRHGRY